MTHLTPLIYVLLSQVQYQTSDPITMDGGISAGWVMVGAFTLIGLMGIHILNNISKSNKDAMITFQTEIKKIHERIDTRENEHDELRDEHGDLKTRVLLIESHAKVHIEHTESQAEHTAKLIMDKLSILQGNVGKHKEKFKD